MGSSHTSQKSPFSVQGRCLGYGADGHKYLRFVTPHAELLIKLAKPLRSVTYTPGQWLHINGTRKVNDRGQVKLKAEAIVKASPVALLVPPVPSPTPKAAAKPATILVCQKSDCCKLGSKAIAKALHQAIEDQGLTEQVTVKATGCMKRCKSGPHLVMPDKTRHSKICPAAVSDLVAQHFPAQVPAQAEPVQVPDSPSLAPVLPQFLAS
jgi:(2Fe-2S) ferredoxin